MMCLNMGSRKERVLPLPVLAIPITSLPDMMQGSAIVWIGVGSIHPFFFKIPVE